MLRHQRQHNRLIYFIILEMVALAWAAQPTRAPWHGSPSRRRSRAARRRRRSSVVLGDLHAADLVAMDLVGAVGETQRALVGVHAGELEDLADAARAMQLQAAVDHLGADVGHRDLDHGDLLAGFLVAV